MNLLYSIGSFNSWGFSSTFDFLECLECCRAPEINILLIDPGDIRHILTTVSRRCRKFNLQNHRINIYLAENSIEELCREILLLEILSSLDIPIRQRSNLFIEIFGNSKLQDRTEKIVEIKGKLLASDLMSKSGLFKDIIDLKLLKYRDKDHMEITFKNYSVNEPFDIDNLRDHRLRGYYAERYDSRVAVSDWDYHYSLKGTAAGIVHVTQFKDWRSNGIAFELNDQQYTKPNRTLMSYTEGIVKMGKDKGLKKEVKGFWGDIVSSPFYSFGIDTETNSEYSNGLFEIVNKDTGSEQHRHHAVEITLHTIISYLWEIQTGLKYTMTSAHDIFSGLGMVDKDIISSCNEDCLISEVEVKVKVNNSVNKEEEKEKEEEEEEEEESKSNLLECMKENDDIAQSRFSKCWDNVKIIPIVCDMKTEFNKQKYTQAFDFVFVSSRAAHVFKTDILNHIVKSNGRLSVETAKYISHLTNKQKTAFITNIVSCVEKCGFQSISEPVSWTLSILGLVSSIIFYQYDSYRLLSRVLFFFTIMEFLQAFQYQVVNDCDNPWNQFLTLLVAIHLTTQTVVINLYVAEEVKDSKVEGLRARFIFMARFSAVCSIISMTRILVEYFGVTKTSRSQCQIINESEDFRGNRMCAISGRYHIAWNFPMADVSYLFPSVNLHALIFCVPQIISYEEPVVVMKGMVYLLTGLITRLFVNNKDEWGAIWCVQSVVIVAGVFFTEMIFRKSTKVDNKLV